MLTARRLSGYGSRIQAMTKNSSFLQFGPLLTLPLHSSPPQHFARHLQEELDKREEQIQALTTKTEELESTVSTLQTELITSHSDTERLTSELDTLRTSHSTLMDEMSTKESSSQSNSLDLMKTRELGEANQRLTLDLETLENHLANEKSLREELESKLELEAQEKMELERKLEEMRELARNEAESARGLQNVLEEFQEGELPLQYLDSNPSSYESQKTEQFLLHL